MPLLILLPANQLKSFNLKFNSLNLLFHF
jgi:hypothetical protein